MPVVPKRRPAGSLVRECCGIVPCWCFYGLRGRFWRPSRAANLLSTMASNLVSKRVSNLVSRAVNLSSNFSISCLRKSALISDEFDIMKAPGYTRSFKEASYSGGGSITFKGTLKDDEYFMTRLFHGKLLLGHLPVHFTYSVKSEGNSLIGLSLEFSSPTEETTSLLLASGRTLVTANQFSSKFSKVIMPQKVAKQGTDSQWVIQESSIAMNGHTLTEISAVCYRPVPEHILFKPKSNSPSKEYFAILGHISIKTSDQNSAFPPSSSWLVEGKNISWSSSSSQGEKTVSVKVMWGLKAGYAASVFPKYNIFVEKVGNSTNSGAREYLGVAQVEAFYVSNVEVPSGISGLKFIVQVCGADGACQKLDESPSFSLPLESS